MVKLYRDTITWKSKTQRGVAYIALALGCKEAITWSGILGRTTNKEFIPLILKDNSPAEQLAKSRNTRRLKHVDISYYLTKDFVKNKRIKIIHITLEN